MTAVIIGAKTVAQLDDNLEATKLKLSAEEIAKLDEISAPAVQNAGDDGYALPTGALAGALRAATDYIP